MSSVVSVKEIYSEWTSDDGALSKMRNGDFDKHACDRLCEILESVDFKEAAQIDRDLVTVIWDIPYFFNAQADHIRRIKPEMQKELTHYEQKIYEEVSRIFGFRSEFCV